MAVAPPYVTYSSSHDRARPDRRWNCVLRLAAGAEGARAGVPGLQQFRPLRARGGGRRRRARLHDVGHRRAARGVPGARLHASCGSSSRSTGSKPSDHRDGEDLLMRPRLKAPRARSSATGHRPGRALVAAGGEPCLDDPRGARRSSTSPGRSRSTSSSPACAEPPAHVSQARLLAEFLTLLRVLRGRDRRPSCACCPAASRRCGRSRTRTSEIGAHDRKLAKYFVAGGALPRSRQRAHGRQEPAVDRRVARARGLRRAPRPRPLEHARDDRRRRDVARHGPHLVRAAEDRAAVRSRARASRSARSGSPRVGLAGLLCLAVGNGIAMGRLVEHGWEYQAAKAHMGNWYKAPDRDGRRRDGPGLLVLRRERRSSPIFQSRLVRVPKPQRHLWKFFATGAAALTVGTVQGVIQVQPANADWLYRAGHAGEWIDPISHAHINLVTGLTMLVAGALFALVPCSAGARRAASWQHLLLRAARLVAHVLRGRALPRLPRGAAGREHGPDAGAGRGAHAAAPVPDHGRRHRHVRGVLVAPRA